MAGSLAAAVASAGPAPVRLPDSAVIDTTTGLFAAAWPGLLAACLLQETYSGVAAALDSARRRRSYTFACSDSTSSAGLSLGTSPEDCSPARLPRRSGSAAWLATTTAGSWSE